MSGLRLGEMSRDELLSIGAASYRSEERKEPEEPKTLMERYQEYLEDVRSIMMKDENFRNMDPASLDEHIKRSFPFEDYVESQRMMYQMLSVPIEVTIRK